MAARDKSHDSTVRSLEKGGWLILRDPYRIKYLDKSLLADVLAVRLENDEERRIVVEIKTFDRESFIYEFYAALGQYLVYRTFLERIKPNESIFIAISNEKYKKEVLSSQAIKMLINHFTVKLVVIDLLQEEIIKWVE